MTRYLVSPTSSSIGIASFPGSRQLMKEGGVNTEVGPGVDLELAYVDPASSQAFQKLSYKENVCEGHWSDTRPSSSSNANERGWGQHR